MAYNDVDITSVKGDTVDGPLWKIKGGIPVDIDINWDPATDPNAVCIGDSSTDGTDFEQSADDTRVQVWGGKTVRVIYSNWEHTVTLRLANSTDTDVLETLVGEENVVTTPQGAKKANFTTDQPPVDGYVVVGKTLDGRRAMAVIPYGQLDPNFSWTWNEEDVVIYEVPIDALVKTQNRAFYLLFDESGS